MSLKKWHKTEKRNIIMKKIMDLEHTLHDDRGDEYIYNGFDNA
jgi:hypothetical protein